MLTRMDLKAIWAMTAIVWATQKLARTAFYNLLEKNENHFLKRYYSVASIKS